MAGGDSGLFLRTHSRLSAARLSLPLILPSLARFRPTALGGSGRRSEKGPTPAAKVKMRAQWQLQSTAVSMRAQSGCKPCSAGQHAPPQRNSATQHQGSGSGERRVPQRWRGARGEERAGERRVGPHWRCAREAVRSRAACFWAAAGSREHSPTSESRSPNCGEGGAGWGKGGRRGRGTGGRERERGNGSREGRNEMRSDGGCEMQSASACGGEGRAGEGNVRSTEERGGDE
jgi:hypothetical protein